MKYNAYFIYTSENIKFKYTFWITSDFFIYLLYCTTELPTPIKSFNCE